MHPKMKRKILDVINTATEVANVTVTVLIPGPLPDLAITPARVILILNFMTYLYTLVVLQVI